MLKAQDCFLLIKLLAHPNKVWTQRQLAEDLQISLSVINECIKRLKNAGLLDVSSKKTSFTPILSSGTEFLIHCVKYLFPVKVGSVTKGIPTSLGAPIFKDKINLEDALIPVWPDIKGSKYGVAFEPIYPTITKVIKTVRDDKFYNLLVLVDAIRHVKSREKNVAIKLLKEILKNKD